MTEHKIETTIHGRYLFDNPAAAPMIVGFHGYAELAEDHLRELHTIEGSSEWTLVSIQGLRTFYTRSGNVVANWMTSQQREDAILDNITYVQRVLRAVNAPDTLVFSGFSQGASMAARAAAFAGVPVAGLILLGGDIPPDVMTSGVKLPPTLLGRGERDDWYSDEKFKNDLRFLRENTQVTECVFDGGHEWTDEFRTAAADFLKRLTR